MRKYIFILLSILTLGVCSCRRGTDTPEAARYAMRENVVFTASASGYVSKATDTALEDGDQMGIFALDPIDVLNVLGTVKGSSVNLQTPIKWELKQEQVTRFVAYMPYDQGLSGMDYAFYVKADQREYSSYAASDLRYAITDSRPGGSVDFLFQHALSKLTVVMEDGAQIQSVTTGELVIGAKVNLVDGSASLTTQNGKITMGKAVAGNGGTGHVAIIVPQQGLFPLEITLATGQTVKCQLDSPATFEPGIAYKATIGLDGDKVCFKRSVTDVADGGAIPDDKPKTL